ncbi:M1 family metallopeptidase [Bailinhaonella thermotolerans]|uniref:Aminopeptidase N n=1 Tax=Bailinhaonella thermotolerans TaxID=1070861 RepID=A0A3A4AV02_9ACTN|nr:M1 family metallopeptidase [Bailinhaonella thermotolerans]RJL34050.1 M1 family peptidase [Bailinhaonella thermotolerans]
MRAFRARLAVAGAGIASLLLVSPALAADTGPGAPGIGDAYFPDYGNGGYDTRHYSLRLKYQPGADRLEGTTRILATATQDLRRFNLDFLLDVSKVRVNLQNASFARTGTHELEITPRHGIRKGTPMVIEVTYAGVPSSVSVPGITTPWLKTADGALALGQPEIAWWWFPSNDHPRDKATYDIQVSVPEGMEAVSNGVLASQRTSRGWTSYHWVMDKPMATYLATLFVGDLEMRQGTSRGRPVITAYNKDLGQYEANAKASVERTAEIVEWLEGIVGKYPFRSMGGSVTSVFPGFALETQTQPVYDPRFFRNAPNTYVVVHENAHQWFGDSVALKKWQDIWLNEALATYAEWMWSERIGEGTAAEVAAFVYASYPEGDAFWQVKPGDPGPSNIFHPAVYDRGGMTVQALRSEVGDEDFFEILRTWAQTKRHGNADTDEFVSLAEKISGEQLDSLFTTWLFTAGRPATPPAPAPVAATAERMAEPKSWPRLKEVRDLLARRH